MPRHSKQIASSKPTACAATTDTKRFRRHEMTRKGLGNGGSASPVLARECSLRLLMLLSHSGRFGDLEIRRTDSKNSPKLPIS